MITLSDIKLEHKEAMDTIRILSAQLQEEGFSPEQKSALISELNYWNTVQDYVMVKYKEKEGKR
jgi:hypothetical protein